MTPHDGVFSHSEILWKTIVITFMEGGKSPQIYNSCTIPEADVKTGYSNNCFMYYI